VLDLALIALRWVQFATAMILFGSSLFAIYGLPREGAGGAKALSWLRPLLASSAAGLLIGTFAAFIVQTAILAGSLSEGMKLQSLWAVITSTAFGPAALIRAVAAALACGLLAARSLTRTVCKSSAMLGAVATASIAWMGHGASTEGVPGVLHLVSDILHALAAGVWIGGLAMFLGLLLRPPGAPGQHSALHKALHGFGGVGAAVVATLLGSGFINSWFLVTPARVSEVLTTPYGQLLCLKLVLFVGMLALAAANRFRLTPALGSALDDSTQASALANLRRSLILETALALAILGLVAWLGTLAPLSAE